MDVDCPGCERPELVDDERGDVPRTDRRDRHIAEHVVEVSETRPSGSDGARLPAAPRLGASEPRLRALPERSRGRLAPFLVSTFTSRSRSAAFGVLASDLARLTSDRLPHLSAVRVNEVDPPHDAAGAPRNG